MFELICFFGGVSTFSVSSYALYSLVRKAFEGQREAEKSSVESRKNPYNYSWFFILGLIKTFFLFFSSYLCLEVFGFIPSYFVFGALFSLICFTLFCLKTKNFTQEGSIQ